MIAIVLVCSTGVAFLLYVLVALMKETRPRFSPQPFSPYAEERRWKRVVVQLPPDPIITTQKIRRAGVPENAPFLIVSNANGAAADFYSNESAAAQPGKETKSAHASGAK